MTPALTSQQPGEAMSDPTSPGFPPRAAQAWIPTQLATVTPYGDSLGGSGWDLKLGIVTVSGGVGQTWAVQVVGEPSVLQGFRGFVPRGFSSELSRGVPYGSGAFRAGFVRISEIRLPGPLGPWSQLSRGAPPESSLSAFRPIFGA